MSFREKLYQSHRMATSTDLARIVDLYNKKPEALYFDDLLWSVTVPLERIIEGNLTLHRERKMTPCIMGRYTVKCKSYTCITITSESPALWYLCDSGDWMPLLNGGARILLPL